MCSSPKTGFHSSGSNSRLKYAVVLNSLFVLIELIAGILSGSLALLTDALHNAVDSLTIGFAWVGGKLANKPADRLRTYGYHRATVLVALFNALILVGVLVGIAYHAVERFAHPVPVDGTMVAVTGLIGIACNLGVVFLIRKHRKELHVEGAYLHNLTDTASSVLMLVSGGLIYLFGVYWVDLALSLVICLALGRSLIPIFGRSLHILLEGAPENAQPEAVGAAILLTPEVTDVHDLHTWLQADGMAAMTCHVVVRNDVPHERDHRVVEAIRAMLRRDFGIVHSTIQVEHVRCEQAPACNWDGR